MEFGRITSGSVLVKNTGANFRTILKPKILALKKRKMSDEELLEDMAEAISNDPERKSGT